MDEQSAPQQSAHEVAATWEPIGSIFPWEHNPRVHTKQAIEDLAASMRRWGFGAPIVCRRQDRKIIKGHRRRLAALHLGLEKVPVRFLDLDPVEAHLLALADNQLPHGSETDETLLGSILADMKAQQVDLTVGTGFSESEIDKLIDGAHGIAEELTGGEPDEDGYKEQYGVIVVCRDEAEQERVYNELHERGYECRVVTT